MYKHQTKRVLPNRIQDGAAKSSKSGNKPSNWFHSLASPGSDEYEVCFPSLPVTNSKPRKELDTPKDLKQKSIDPSLYMRIIEEALSIHDNLEVFIRDTPMEVKLNELFRFQKKFLEAEVEDYSICPDFLLPEKIDAIVARIRKLKSLNPEVGTGIFESPGSESDLSGNGVGHEEPNEYRAEVKENNLAEGNGEEDKIGDDEEEEDESSSSGEEDTVIDESSGCVVLAEMCTEEVEKNKQGLIEEKQRSAQPIPLTTKASGDAGGDDDDHKGVRREAIPRGNNGERRGWGRRRWPKVTKMMA
ncbi:hypothetical protein U1Q18_017897 [Sarracenia purpurea var. burkii]